MSRLSILHNFTVESQVQYYAPLAFEPKRLTFGDTESSGLTQEDLTVFVNSAEWSLGQYCIVFNGVNT
jgi:phosphatidylinositol glycan class S